MAIVVILAAATLASNAYNEKETVNNEAIRWQTLIETARNDAIAQREPRIVTINLYPKQVTENYAPQQGTEGKTLAAYTLPAKVTFVAGTAPLRICYDAFGTLEIPNAQGGFTPLDVNTPSIAFYLTNKTATVTEKVTIYRNSGAVAVSYGTAPAPGEGTFTLTYTAGSGGTLAGNKTQTVKAGASGTPVTVVPSINYNFVAWSDGVATATRTDTNVTADLAVTATFTSASENPNTYTLTYTAGSGGTIAGTSPQTVTSGAAGTAVTARPTPGYHFGAWSDGRATATRTDTNVTANITVTATFTAFSENPNTYTLTYTADGNGTIAGTTPQTVTSGAAGTAVTARPTPGYHFGAWSDGRATATRTDTNVTADIAVTATFGRGTYTITASAGSNGSVTPMGATLKNFGESQTYAITPAAGYNIASLTVDGGGAPVEIGRAHV